MTEGHESDRREAVGILTRIAPDLTPAIALALAGMLLHLAGGDGRGVYSIVYDPTGDRA